MSSSKCVRLSSGHSFAQRNGEKSMRAELAMAMLCVSARLGITPPRGLLLYGPPGCSKTSLVRALATSAHVSILTLNGASAMSAYIGEVVLHLPCCHRLFR